MANLENTPSNESSESILARHYQDGLTHRIFIENGRYRLIESLPQITDPSLPWIAPGLFDPQINGFGGVDFNSSSASLERADRALGAHGCTHYLLTLITSFPDEYAELFQHWENQRQGTSNGMMGYHLEGPFLNPDPGYRGVHRIEAMAKPSLDFLQFAQKASHGSLRLITLAPEMDWPESLTFITLAAQQGLRLAAGHSSLMGQELEEARTAGLSAWTHLGNAAPAQTHKFENVLLHALASSLTYLSLIPDGLHLPPHAFQALARALGGRLLLTTDAIAGAGAACGRYTLGKISVQVHADGRATLPDTDKLAGSTLTPFAGVFQAATMSHLPWSSCWEAFSTRTASWLGIPHRLQVGFEASFCLFDTDPTPRLRSTWRRGQRIFGDVQNSKE